MNLRNYYQTLNKDEKRKFFVLCIQKCKVSYGTIQSWISNHENASHRTPDIIRRPILAKITGISEDELFKAPEATEIQSNT
jgi:hypothetical protein